MDLEDVQLPHSETSTETKNLTSEVREAVQQTGNDVETATNELHHQDSEQHALALEFCRTLPQCEPSTIQADPDTLASLGLPSLQRMKDVLTTFQTLSQAGADSTMISKTLRAVYADSENMTTEPGTVNPLPVAA